ncbi:hypothetical protein TNCT_145731 [Trichonephila clavata]|uniref:Uncharacterized protein n=1 Tax=Trichonephila clavata TaxID=2740835 RepID=A0A8X6J651_TRICU|nr:hypothetical protein TNCT_145731 [Trichonephila clavata]
MFENYHLSSFYRVGGYILLIETIKYCAFSGLFEKTQHNTTTLIAHSVITSKICQDWDIQTPLAALDIKPKLILEHKGKNFIPKVYSEFVFKICGALMIETQLSSMEQNSNWIGKQKIEKEEPSCCSFRRLQDLRCFRSLCSTMSSDCNQRIDLEHETENEETHP